MKLAVIVLLTATMAMGQAKCKNQPVCDTNSQQAYNYMHSRFGQTDWPDELWIDGDGYSDHYRLRLERREHAFESIYKWAQSLPPDQRRAWEGVLDSYMDGAIAAHAEWYSHEVKNHMDAYRKHQQECEEAARHAAKLPTPPAILK
jgi:hypothetical protein